MVGPLAQSIRQRNSGVLAALLELKLLEISVEKVK